MTDFAPGDVVVCVDNSLGRYAPERLLVTGHIYRIRDSHIAPNGEPAVCVEGVVHPVPYRTGRERGWYPYRFRKLKAADEQFTEQMRALRPAKVPATLPRSSENRNG